VLSRKLYYATLNSDIVLPTFLDDFVSFWTIFVKAPSIASLSLYETSEKPKRLYFGVYETDKHFIMTPAGNGYLVEYDSN
jgi:hypothetical protein